MLLLAHRGASQDAPENTLEAFAEAVAQRADGIELDAMVCGSGEVVVCHDDDLRRLGHLPWRVRHTSYWKLRTADVGSPLGFAPARIPLLDEVLAALPADFVVNIELKCDEADDGGLSAKVARRVRELGIEDRVVLSSFNPLCLFRAAAVEPSLRRGFLIDPDKAFLPQRALVPLVSNHSVHPYFGQVTLERAEAWRAAKLQLAVWTVDDGEEARRLRELGCRYLITNRPGELRRALEG